MTIMHIRVASQVDRDDLFAEIYAGDEQWAEVYPDLAGKALRVRIFTPSAGSSYDFDLQSVLESLEEAKRRLTELGYAS